MLLSKQIVTKTQVTTATVAPSIIFATEVVKEEQKEQDLVRNCRREEEWKRSTMNRNFFRFSIIDWI